MKNRLEYPFIALAAAHAREKLRPRGERLALEDLEDYLAPSVEMSGDRLMPENLHAISVLARGKGTTLVNRNVPVPVQRFAVSHEIYHYYSDLDPTIVASGIRHCLPSVRGAAFRRDMDNEHACDLFAGELLVPLPALHLLAPDDLAPRRATDRAALADRCARLADHFGVTVEVIRWRLRHLAAWRRAQKGGTIASAISAVTSLERVEIVPALPRRPKRHGAESVERPSGSLASVTELAVEGRAGDLDFEVLDLKSATARLPGGIVVRRGARRQGVG